MTFSVGNTVVVLGLVVGVVVVEVRLEEVLPLAVAVLDVDGSVAFVSGVVMVVVLGVVAFIEGSCSRLKY